MQNKLPRNSKFISIRRQNFSEDLQTLSGVRSPRVKWEVRTLRCLLLRKEAAEVVFVQRQSCERMHELFGVEF